MPSRRNPGASSAMSSPMKHFSLLPSTSRSGLPPYPENGLRICDAYWRAARGSRRPWPRRQRRRSRASSIPRRRSAWRSFADGSPARPQAVLDEADDGRLGIGKMVAVLAEDGADLDVEIGIIDRKSVV